MAENLEGGHIWDDSWRVDPPETSNDYDPKELLGIPGFVPSDKVVLPKEKADEPVSWD